MITNNIVDMRNINQWTKILLQDINRWLILKEKDKKKKKENESKVINKKMNEWSQLVEITKIHKKTKKYGKKN